MNGALRFMLLGPAVVALAGCSGESASTMTLTHSGVEGIQRDDSYERVAKKLGALPIVFSDVESGMADGVAPICRGQSRGYGVFWSWRTDDPSGSDGEDSSRLVYLWFFDGVRTDEGVRIGSSLRDLRDAYGEHLIRHRLDFADYLPNGSPYQSGTRQLYYVQGGRGEMPLWFGINAGKRVVGMGYGDPRLDSRAGALVVGCPKDS
jgi:hypothetical protein